MFKNSISKVQSEKEPLIQNQLSPEAVARSCSEKFNKTHRNRRSHRKFSIKKAILKNICERLLLQENICTRVLFQLCAALHSATLLEQGQYLRVLCEFSERFQNNSRTHEHNCFCKPYAVLSTILSQLTHVKLLQRYRIFLTSLKLNCTKVKNTPQLCDDPAYQRSFQENLHTLSER